jgi:hypothetical protein
LQQLFPLYVFPYFAKEHSYPMAPDLRNTPYADTLMEIGKNEQDGHKFLNHDLNHKYMEHMICAKQMETARNGKSFKILSDSDKSKF